MKNTILFDNQSLTRFTSEIFAKILQNILRIFFVYNFKFVGKPILLFVYHLYIKRKLLMEENKKKLTICQRNEKLKKILWILGRYNNGHVIKHVNLQFEDKVLHQEPKNRDLISNLIR